MTVEEIVENFELLDDWEERYRYIIDLGKKLAPLPDEMKVESALVPGCISRVWLHCTTAPAVGAERDGAKGLGAMGDLLHFQADSDAIIVKGLVAIVLSLYDAKTADEILTLDVSDLFDRLDLGNQLSANRRNGFVSMLGQIRAFAQQHAN
mgnify:CR=1 FL=1